MDVMSARDGNPQVPSHVVISQDFLPGIGGAHTWIYEVYRRWPTPVTVLARTEADRPNEARKTQEFDGEAHGSLRIRRVIPPTGDFSILKRQCVASYWSQMSSLRLHSGKGGAVIHCLRAIPDGLAGALFRRMFPRSTRLIIYAHGEEILITRTSRQLSYFASLAYSTADLVIANSRNTQGLLADLFPKSSRSTCIHPGVDIERYRPESARVSRYRESFGWPPGTPIVTTLGRMEPRKNHVMGIRALARLHGEGLRFGYVCAGDGEERVELVRLAAELKVQEWVRFPGAVPELEKSLLFAASDVFLMASIRVGEMIEGFGIVFLEAAAAGVPSICGSSGGQPEAVLDGRTGLVVNGDSLEEVVIALRKLLSDESLRARMGAGARVWAQQNSWDAIAARTRQAVEGIMGT